MEEKVITNNVFVFISSTIDDLQKERKTVKDAILEANASLGNLGVLLFPIDLQQGASQYSPLEECLKKVASSHILIGLIGMRYGIVDEKTNKSISELEYDKAVECNIPVLMYVSENINRNYIDTPDMLVRLSTFKRKVEQNHKRDTFDSCDKLRGHVLRDLPNCVIEKYVSYPTQTKEQAIESPQTPAKEGVVGVVPLVCPPF